MDTINNNQFEFKPSAKSKRKLPATCSNVYFNPGLNLLANDDPICNNAMEIVPSKKRKRTRSLDIAAFENSALDLGITKAAVNEFLVKELENVRRNVRKIEINPSNTRVSASHDAINSMEAEPIYANLNYSDPCLALPRENVASHRGFIETNKEYAVPENNYKAFTSEVPVDSGISLLEQKSLNPSRIFDNEISAIDHINSTADVRNNIHNQIFINNQGNLNLSFIDRLGLNSSNLTNQSLVLDDDLNESNIMEIKTITIITKKKHIQGKKKNTNPFLNLSLDENALENINNDTNSVTQENPFLSLNDTERCMEMEYDQQIMAQTLKSDGSNVLIPRRLFTSDVNSTTSTENESETNVNQNEYENIDFARSESPIYENIGDESINTDTKINKQSKILGHDVSQFNARDIMNLNKLSSKINISNESSDSKKDLKHQLFRAGKLSRKVLNKIKKTFKPDKIDTNVTLNPYEVPRKPTKQKPKAKEEGIENPALNLDNSDEIEIEVVDDDVEHQYETVKTLRNTRLNMNVTPLKERGNDQFEPVQNRVNHTPGRKQVRFDSTLNQEKVITGNSFEGDVQSPGFDAKIDKYHDELENCINERKFIQQNM